MLVKARLIEVIKINEQKTQVGSVRLKLVKLVSARKCLLTDYDVLHLMGCECGCDF